jgi:AAA domain
MPLEPDRDAIEIFIDALFRYAAAGHFLSLRSFFEDRGEGKPFFIIPTKLNGDFGVLCNIVTDAARHAANAAAKVVFAPPVATFHDGRRATEADIAEGLVLSVECDTRPQEGRVKLEDILGRATIVTRSGGRWRDPQTGALADKLHLHWRLAETASDKPALKKLKRARDLAARIVGADPSGKSVVHPYRWPGSWHRKAEPRLCEIETANPDAEIVLEVALEALEDAAGGEPEGKGAQESSEHEHRREWEKDFSEIISGRNYHPVLTPLASSFASWGMPEPAAYNVLRSLLINSTTQDTTRLRRRDTELAKLQQTVASGYAKFGKAEQAPIKTEWRFHDNSKVEATAWMIKDILPETGAGLISGQWGTYKTTVALDIAISVMTANSFAGRFFIKRPGGVVYFAPEGGGGLNSRLMAAAHARGIHDPLPFAYRDDCPPLTAMNAVTKLVTLVEDAQAQLKQRFNVDVVLVFIDTMITAAAYARPGDENDAAMGQRLMSALASLSRRIGALVIGVDHFGKSLETGTRGTSAKEAHADVVLASLADRELGGAVTNTRLTLRKLREGAAGLELPFTPKTLEIGTTDDDEPVVRVIIEWSSQASPPPDAYWSKSLKLLRRILMTILADHGKDIAPFADGPTVRACHLDLVRVEFGKQYVVADSSADAEQQANTRRKAFQRAVAAAQAKGLIGIREIANASLIWLTRAEDSRA